MNLFKKNQVFRKGLNSSLSKQIFKMEFLCALNSIQLFFGVILLNSIGHACIEKPKEIGLSGASFNESTKISYGVNCRVNISVVSEKVSRTFVFSTEKQSICMNVRSKEADGNREVCGKDLIKANGLTKEDLTLRDVEGKAVGFIQVSENGFRVLSGGAKPDTREPFLDFSMSPNSAGKVWDLSANDSENEQVGKGEIQSKLCTRSMSAGKTSEAIDLRGHELKTAGVGCSAGAEIVDFKKPVRERASLRFEGER